MLVKMRFAVSVIKRGFISQVTTEHQDMLTSYIHTYIHILYAYMCLCLRNKNRGLESP